MKRSRSSRSSSAPHCIASLSREANDLPELPVYRKTRRKGKPAPKPTKPTPVICTLEGVPGDEEFYSGLIGGY